MAASNEYWVGSNGTIWINDKEHVKTSSFEAKMVFEWEDVPNGLRTERVLLGYGHEGSFKYRMTDSNASTLTDLLLDSMSKGVVPDISIVCKATNKASGKTERYKFTGITFDELPIQNWEEKTVVEKEFAFKADECIKL